MDWRLFELVAPQLTDAVGDGGVPDVLRAQLALDRDLVTTLLMFGFMFLVIYLLIIRPQQRRVREHQSMLKALRRGDEVITGGGFLGKITKVSDDADDVEVELSEGVRVRVVKNTIASVKAKTEPRESAS